MDILVELGKEVSVSDDSVVKAENGLHEEQGSFLSHFSFNLQHLVR